MQIILLLLGYWFILSNALFAALMKSDAICFVLEKTNIFTDEKECYTTI